MKSKLEKFKQYHKNNKLINGTNDNISPGPGPAEQRYRRYRVVYTYFVLTIATTCI